MLRYRSWRYNDGRRNVVGCGVATMTDVALQVVVLQRWPTLRYNVEKKIYLFIYLYFV
jgi:hypothetical protein